MSELLTGSPVFAKLCGQRSGSGRRRWRPGLGAIGVLAIAVASGGCSSLKSASFLPPIFRSFGAPAGPTPAPAGEGTTATSPGDKPKSTAKVARARSGATGSVEIVERSLRERGLRFGTDGTPEALYQYVRYSHELVPPERARAGDIVFFDMGEHGCGEHLGLVEAVEGQGRIVFRESRGGVVRRSFVHPGAPRVRRDADGKVLNTFLRPRRMEDPPEARYFAGEMLCAVGHVEVH
jgi:hypothetical protein